VQQYFLKIPSATNLASSSNSNVLAGSSADPAHDDGNDNPESADPLSPPSESLPHTITVKRKADFLEPTLDAMISQAVTAAMPKASQPSKKRRRIWQAN